MRYFLILFSFLAFTPTSYATPITFTGAELAALPNATAVGGIHSISGDSLLLTATSNNQILFNLNLSEFILTGEDIGIVANATRLTTTGGIRNSDIRLGVTDTRNYVYAEFDNFSTQPNVLRGHRHGFVTNNGQNFSQFGAIGDGPIFGYEFGEAANLSVILRPTPGFTQIFSTFNGQGGFTSVTDTNRLDPVFFDLSFTIGGASAGERYQINAVSFFSGVALPEPQAVSEPGAFGGLALSLAAMGLGLYRRRFV